MRITIEFSRNKAVSDAECQAKTVIEDITYYGYGESWSVAEKALLDQVKKVRDPNYVPPSRIVEI